MAKIYKGLDIATNKVSAVERRQCIHHMIDLLQPQTANFTVVQFRNAALPLINDIISREKIPFLVGGTNYYIEALLWDFLIDSENEATQSTESDSDLRSESNSQTEATNDKTPENTRKRLKLDSDPDKTGCHLKAESLPSGSDYSREKLELKTTSELYEVLWNVDRERAERLQPNDRRKILRSLEVFYRDGQKMSELLKKQHQQTGENAVSGPLRFSHICVLWIQCAQEELDARNEKRVDEMIKQGLIKELTDFHNKYNEARLKENKEADYSQGIFQSIGFKEFHEYLLLSEEERNTPHGEALLKKGIEGMKIATRQYARRQKKWIVRRFLKRRGGSVPPVYAVDGTDKDRWEENVLIPACDILKHYIEDKEPPYQALPVEESDYEPTYNKCDLCGVVTLTVRDWRIHVSGRRHRKNVSRFKHSEKRGKEIVDSNKN